MINVRAAHRRGQARLVALAATDVAALWALRPRPGRLLQVAAHPVNAMTELGPDHVVALGVTAALWLAAAWIAVGLLAAFGTRLPGMLGRSCAVVAGVALPAAVRRVVVGAIGLGMLAGPTTAALATPPHAGPPTRVPAVVRHLGAPKPGPSWPTSTPTHPTRHAPDRNAGSRDAVRVRAGDSLWLIAAHRLGDGTTAERIAAYWPQVYAANRSIVGPDPGLLVPGQVLHLPDPGTH